MMFYVSSAIGGMVPVLLVTMLLSWLFRKFKVFKYRARRQTFAVTISVIAISVLYMHGSQTGFAEGFLIYAISGYFTLTIFGLAQKSENHQPVQELKTEVDTVEL